MVNIRSESPVDTYLSVQYGDNSNFDGTEKIIKMYSYALMVVSYTMGSILSYSIQRM